MILITSYYKSTNLERQNEIDTCLKMNIANTLIKNIYLLNTNEYEFDFISNISEKNKIQQIILPNKIPHERLKYSEAINFANLHFKNEICIILNSDIYCDETLQLLLDYDLTNKVLALTRYDKNILYNVNDSQDTWIFKSPLNINLIDIDFYFGIPGCDNKLAYILHNNKHIVYNPSLTIKTHHLHSSEFRTYTEKNRIKGPYKFLTHTTLGNVL